MVGDDYSKKKKTTASLMMLERAKRVPLYYSIWTSLRGPRAAACTGSYRAAPPPSEHLLIPEYLTITTWIALSYVIFEKDLIIGVHNLEGEN
jgi:hypothetical protein